MGQVYLFDTASSEYNDSSLYSCWIWTHDIHMFKEDQVYGSSLSIHVKNTGIDSLCPLNIYEQHNVINLLKKISLISKFWCWLYRLRSFVQRGLWRRGWRRTRKKNTKLDIETTHDEGTSKANTSKFVSKDFEEIDAMIDEDVVAAIDRVLLEGITFSLKSQHYVQGQEASKLDPNLFEQLFQELRDIAFKEDLVEKFKEGLSLKVNFDAVKEKIDDNAEAFSSDQLEQLGVVVSFLNHIVRILRNSTIWKKKSTTRLRKTLAKIMKR